MTAPRSTGQVGIVGLGLMGHALASRLLAAGARPAGFDVDPAKRARLAEAGGQACATLSELAQVATDLVLCVFNAQQAHEVVLALPDHSGGRGAGLTVLCTTTADPAEMARLGESVEARGHAFIEMPVSGSSVQFAQGKAVGLVACRRSVLEAKAALVAAVCSDHRHLGETFGDASRAKLAINLVLGINRAALAEGLAFAKALGLSPAAFFEVLRGSAAYSQVMDVKGRAMVERRFEPPQSRVDQSYKDFSLIVGLGHAAGLGLPFASRYAAMMADCIEHGEAHLDNAIILAAIERQPAPVSRKGSTT